MASPSLHPTEASLPTLSKLNATVPDSIDAYKVASTWLSSFSSAVSACSVPDILSLLVPATFSSYTKENSPDALSLYWRDMLALTWDFRTFEGVAKIHQFLVDRLEGAKITNIQLRQDVPPMLQRPYPDLAWVSAMFSFETEVGLCSGIVRIVPLGIPKDSKSDQNQVSEENIEWKAHTIYTNLEELKNFPEKIGSLRNNEPNHGKWETSREEEVSFANSDPTVLIIGGGQSGLDVAARLKTLDVSCLVVEKAERIGDEWRTRYEALCLHDPVWYDHMPYLPFPPNWPVYTPAKKLANWLESYASAMELNIWTSSAVTHASQDPNSQIWSVTVKREKTGDERVFRVKHLVFATGFGGGTMNLPVYPGMDTFKGQILHSLQHHRASDHKGKKVVVVGSCTSAHDICVDYYENDVDVTMFQRSSTYVITAKSVLKILLGGAYREGGPPTDIADRMSASFPNLSSLGLSYRSNLLVQEADKEILDGLHARGFRTNSGFKDSGFLMLVWERAGGYYLDVGGSQHIIDGHIKLKNDAQIECFTQKGLKFDNGSELDADVVVFCTGLGNPRDSIRRICGDKVADECNPIWGLNSEGELNGVWRDLGFKGLWFMMGNLALCRFHSKHLALQIKTMEEGVFGERYSLKDTQSGYPK